MADMRIRVWKETKVHFAAQPEFKSTVIEEVPVEMPPRPYETTEISFVHGDCINEAIRLKHAGFRPLLLNMADWDIAGGCVEEGSRAQEEELFRRSNYHKFLHQSAYPLRPFTNILSHAVTFARYSAEKEYAWMPNPVTLDCIAAPALQNPPLTEHYTRYANPTDADIMRKKMRMLFSIAAHNNNDALVLSAWGCGAFHCPPEHTAELFAQVVQEYRGVLKTVVFGITGPVFNRFLSAFQRACTVVSFRTLG